MHPCDRGVQYLSVRYTDRLDAAGALRAVGSKGDSYDNAAAGSLIDPNKTELIRRRNHWKGLDDVELATLEYVDWFNHAACTAPAATPDPSSSSSSTTVRSPPSAPRSRHNQASTEPGAVHIVPATPGGTGRQALLQESRRAPPPCGRGRPAHDRGLAPGDGEVDLPSRSRTDPAGGTAACPSATAGSRRAAGPASGHAAVGDRRHGWRQSALGGAAHLAFAFLGSSGTCPRPTG